MEYIRSALFWQSNEDGADEVEEVVVANSEEEEEEEENPLKDAGGVILENKSREGEYGMENGQTSSRAHRSLVEIDDMNDPEKSKSEVEIIGTKHLIKIFFGGKEDISITPEQLDRVRKMHKGIRQATRFCFNYNTLLLVASVLAALGLVSNSTATVIASMLVSPLMGPVIGLGEFLFVPNSQQCCHR